MSSSEHFLTNEPDVERRIRRRATLASAISKLTFACAVVATVLVADATASVARKNPYLEAKQHSDACNIGLNKIIALMSPGADKSADREDLWMQTNDQCWAAANALPHTPSLDLDVARFYILFGARSGSAALKPHQLGEQDLAVAYREAVRADDVFTAESACAIARAFRKLPSDPTCSDALMAQWTSRAEQRLAEMRRENEVFEAQTEEMNREAFEANEAWRWSQENER